MYLHVSVFDAIVNHLDVVSGAAFPDPVTARITILNFGTDRLKIKMVIWELLENVWQQNSKIVIILVVFLLNSMIFIIFTNSL